MIQRVQSIYLLLASLAIFALFLFPLAHHVYINSIPSMIKVTGVYQDAAGHPAMMQGFTMLMILTVIVALVPLFIIFQYRDRKKQLLYCYGYIVLVIAYSYLMVHTVSSAMGGFTLTTDNFGIGALLSSVSIVLVIFGVKAIQRDEKLIKSADRLR